MKYVLIAVLSVLLLPAMAQAGNRWSFSVGVGFGGWGGCGSSWGGWFGPTWGWNSSWCGPAYRPAYFPRVYSAPVVYTCNTARPYAAFNYQYYASRHNNSVAFRYADNRSDYRRGDVQPDRYAYRSAPYQTPAERYYGPALERYARDARERPSYHYERREAYSRGR
jgi:hypothetical protein